MPLSDILLLIAGFVALIVGLLGVVLPLLPGSFLSLLGILLIHWTGSFHLPSWWLWLFIWLTMLAQLIDYYLPIWWTKKYGGTKAGITGSTLGMIAGIFVLPPWGMIILPFVGAFLGEYFIAQWTREQALQSARGAFVWFLLTTGFKIILWWWMLLYAIFMVF